MLLVVDSYQQAKPYFVAGFKHLYKAVQDAAEALKALIDWGGRGSNLRQHVPSATRDTDGAIPSPRDRPTDREGARRPGATAGVITGASRHRPAGIEELREGER